jgi:hypothetical protein
MEFREGRDSMQQDGARQGGVAAFKCGIGRLKVGFAPGEMTVVIAVGRHLLARAPLLLATLLSHTSLFPRFH